MNDATKNSKKKSKNKQKEDFKPADNCLDHVWIADVIVYDNVTGLKSVQNLQNGNFVDENLLIGSRETNVITVKGGLISERCFTFVLFSKKCVNSLTSIFQPAVKLSV